MTVYAWPDFGVEDFELHIVGNGTEYANPSSKEVQVLDDFGEYWAGSFSLPPGTDPAEGATRQAFFDRLLGRVHRMSMHDLRFPQPRGNARGTMVLSAVAAQFSTSLTIAGLTARPNLVPYASFETDTNGDGLANGWQLVVGGAGDGSRTHIVQRLGSPSHGTYIQYVEVTASSNTNPTTLLPVARIGVSPSTSYAVQADLRTNTTGKVVLIVRWYDGSGAQLGDSTVGPVSAASYTAPRVVSGVFTSPAAAATCDVLVRGIHAVGEYIGLDAVQLEAGTAPSAFAGFARLEPGDMLGVGGQLVRVMEPAAATEAGVMTVQVLPRLRQAVASGSAVQWDKPTANFLVMADEVVTRWRGGAQFEASRDIRIVEA